MDDASALWSEETLTDAAGVADGAGSDSVEARATVLTEAQTVNIPDAVAQNKLVLAE